MDGIVIDGQKLCGDPGAWKQEGRSKHGGCYDVDVRNSAIHRANAN